MTKRRTKISEIVDDDGLPSIVLHPDTLPADEGIPVHLDLTPIYGHLPDEWQRQLYAALWARGLKLPEDYLKPDAANQFKSALLHVIKHHFPDVQQLAREAKSRH
jgi:hypothetical protein